MLGKNNNNERLKKMEMQDKQDHFSIRKLTIGTASVLLGFTFFGLNTQTAKADTVDASQEVSKKTDSLSTSDSQKANSQDDNTQNANHLVDVSTYSGLSSFLRDGSVPPTTNSSSSTSQTGKTNATNGSDQQNSANQKPGSDTADSKDQTSTGNSDTNQTGETTDTSDKGGTTTKPIDPTDPAAKVPDTAKTTEIKTKDASVAQVHSFTELIAAFQNESISEIDVMNDITDGPENGSQAFYFYGRKMLIKSGGNGNTRFKVDLKGNHLQLNSGSTKDLDITYDNLDLWSADIWGVIMTDDYNKDGHFSKITFNNVNFHGSQMVHCGNNTKIYFTGTNYGEVTHTPYPGITISSGDVQQLFEFTGSNNSIDFSGTFTGKTVGGNVLEMAGSNNVVNIAKDAKVTLSPRIYFPNNGLGSNAAEHTGLPLAIAMLGNNEAVNVDGELNIIVGSDHYNGTNDNDQSSAILINDGNSCLLYTSPSPRD